MNSADKGHSKMVDSLYELVVSKHDKVMPKTSDMSKLTNILRNRLKNENDSIVKEKILNLLQGLHSGHDAMFDWMGTFKNLHLNKDFYEKKSEMELLTYLKEEEIKIDNVASLMIEGIAKAELFLKDNN